MNKTLMLNKDENENTSEEGRKLLRNPKSINRNEKFHIKIRLQINLKWCDICTWNNIYNT